MDDWLPAGPITRADDDAKAIAEAIDRALRPVDPVETFLGEDLSTLVAIWGEPEHCEGPWPPPGMAVRGPGCLLRVGLVMASANVGSVFVCEVVRWATD